MHSYWDDFFALRGFRDAAVLAGALGDSAEQARWRGVADEFARDLGASVVATMRKHDIPYVPGCADLGDFDATSTAIALDPTNAAAVLPADALRATFDRYWTFFRQRRDGGAWTDYTPYEMRVMGALVRLGHGAQAGQMLDWFLGQQTPPGWRQWPEVVRREARTPHFVGDLPHTWVGAEFLRSLADMLAWNDEARQALVVGAGVQLAWIGDSGLFVHGLPTPWGHLDFAMRQEEPFVTVRLGGDLRVPPGGILVCRPPTALAVGATIDGREVTPATDGTVAVRNLPATVIWHP